MSYFAVERGYRIDAWVICALSLALGGGVRAYIGVPNLTPNSVMLTLGAIVALLIGAVRYKAVRDISVILLMIGVGFWRMDTHLPNRGAPLSCTGTWQIARVPIPQEPVGQRLALTQESGNCPAIEHKTLLATDYVHRDWQLGEVFATSLTFRPAARAYYTELPKKLEGRWDQPTRLQQLQRTITARIRRIFPISQATWVEALILGNRAGLTARDKQMLRRTGSSHLLAISGLHLAVIAGAIFLFIRWLWAQSRRLSLWVEPRSIAIVISLLGGGVWGLITGGQPPIVRAWVMFAGIASQWFFPWVRTGIIGLWLALGVIVLVDPLSLLNSSTWLSFLATMLVLVVAKRIRLLTFFWQWLWLQAAVTLVLIPFIWANFGGLSIVGYGVNLILVPWLGVLLAILLLAIILPVIAGVAVGALTAYLSVIRYAGEIPYAYVEPHWQPALVAAIFVAVAGIFFIAQRYRCMGLCILLAAGYQWWFSTHLPNIVTIPGRIPSTIIFTSNGAVVINTGYRARQRDDAQLKLLPQIRQRNSDIRAIVLSSSSLYANSALKTLLDAYPNTPVYTLVPMPTLPFAHRYCPADSVLNFKHTDEGCVVDIDNHWIVSPERSGVRIRSR